MRKLILIVAILAAAAVVRAEDKGERVRVPMLDGIYWVTAPSEWHVEISGDDLTATFAEEPGADGTLVIAAPNPAVDDIRAFTRRAASALLDAFGNGEIDRDEADDADGFPAYAVWFSFDGGGVPFRGWGRTINFDGVAVQAMALATAEQFDAFMEAAGPIFDSYELDTAMVAENADLLHEIGGKVAAALKQTNAEPQPDVTE